MLSQQIIPVIFSQVLNSEQIFIIHKKNILLILLGLKPHIKFQYKMLPCISGVDFLSTKFGKSFGFGVVYDLISLTFNTGYALKVIQIK